jgi:hypothetical protein
VREHAAFMFNNIRGKFRGIRNNKGKFVGENQNYELQAVEGHNADPRLVKLCAITGRFCFGDIWKRELKKEEARNYIYVSRD